MLNLAFSSIPSITFLFPFSYTSSRGSSNIPSLGGLQKRAEQLNNTLPSPASALNPLPPTALACEEKERLNRNDQDSVRLPSKVRSTGLPIPKFGKSWYTPSSYIEDTSSPPSYEQIQLDNDHNYAIQIGFRHGYDHIYRLGKNSNNDNNDIPTGGNRNEMFANKLWKTWNGFRPIQLQNVIPEEEEEIAPKTQKRYSMESRNYVDNSSFRQTSINDILEGNRQQVTWTDWLTCKVCV
ncbi:uncharacterized protein L201_007856 [Kwoniella dendrophila CBS 6074]|uniref:Uncharacterized protein n=1 Tax=Kwoniella dendrophila CBS 6074 TaxID=1295534 RepID=A0AAX4K670_9TREE